MNDKTNDNSDVFSFNNDLDDQPEPSSSVGEKKPFIDGDAHFVDPENSSKNDGYSDDSDNDSDSSTEDQVDDEILVSSDADSQRVEENKKKAKKYLLIGGGVSVVVIAAVLGLVLTGGGNKPSSFNAATQPTKKQELATDVKPLDAPPAATMQLPDPNMALSPQPAQLEVQVTGQPQDGQQLAMVPGASPDIGNASGMPPIPMGQGQPMSAGANQPMTAVNAQTTNLSMQPAAQDMRISALTKQVDDQLIEIAELKKVNQELLQKLDGIQASSTTGAMSSVGNTGAAVKKASVKKTKPKAKPKASDMASNRAGSPGGLTDQRIPKPDFLNDGAGTSGSYTVQAILPDLAWIKNTQTGQSFSVKKGGMLPGDFKIVEIDVDKLYVKTNKGIIR